MTRQELIARAIKNNPKASQRELAKITGTSKSAVARVQKKLLQNMPEPVKDSKLNNVSLELARVKTKYKEAVDIIAEQQSMIDSLCQIPDTPSVVHIRRTKNVKREIVPVLVASDWHIEEQVNSSITNGLNEYNLDIAQKRIEQFFNNACTLINREQQDCVVNSVILAILGDIINGVLRAEDLQTNQLTSVDAIAIARSYIYAGIKKLVNETGCSIHVICCVGNHGRLTEKIFPSNQVHNSLEYLMYKILERDFRDNPKVTFTVSEAYYYIQDVFDMKVRFHHGHAIRYNGGLGGLAIPIQRKLAQMNQIQKADLDVIGHFHQLESYNNCIVNGSLVGMNGYSMSLGLPYQPPRQVMFVVDSKYGRSSVYPVFAD